MRFATLQIEGARVPAVAASDGTLVLLRDIGVQFNSVRAVIEGGEEALGGIAKALAASRARGLDPETVEWAAPVADPSKILCIALNNSAIDRILAYRPDFPVYFPKLPSALSGNGETLDLHGHFGLVHPEPELAVVIGKKARNISIDDAMDYVFGYSIFNDVTSIGMRREDNFFAEYVAQDRDGNATEVAEHLLYPGRYKSADGFAPMGPYLVHKDEIKDPMALRIRCWIDGELMMDDNTGSYHFSVPELIHWISAHSTLLPGDVISLGTALHPDDNSRPVSYGDMNRFGASVRVEIDELGALTTPIRRIRGEDPRVYFGANKKFKRLTSV